jgi:hypothetical protein
MFKHIKDNNISYWEHWYNSTKIGLALLVHAWFPDILTDYASKNLCKETEEDWRVTQYNRNRSAKDGIKSIEEIK